MIDQNLESRLQSSEDSLNTITNKFENDWKGKVTGRTMRGPALTRSKEALGDSPSIELVLYLIEKYPNVMWGRVLLHVVDGITEDPTQNIFTIVSKSLGIDNSQLGFTSKKRLWKLCNKALFNFSKYPMKIIRDIRLLSAEQRLETRIKESEVPFLGLIDGDIRGTIKRAIDLAKPSISDVNDYIRAMQKHPALLCLRITLKINGGMGQQAINDVWPHVSSAIGVNSIPNTNDRVKVWSAFREAIISLGLEPSPRTHGQNYMKDEFLRQTGIPVAYVHHLADGMLDFAHRSGVPDESDDEGIRAWQKALCETDELGIQTVIKAVSLDSKGYFTSRFISIHNHGLPENPTDLDKAIFESLHIGHNPISPTRVPYIAFDGHSLGVDLPRSGNLIYSVTIDDGVPTDYDTSSASKRFCCLDAPRPKKVRISWGVEGDDAPQSKDFNIWNEGDNCLLIFNEESHLTERATLNQLEIAELPPGYYQLLSHFKPSNDDLEIIDIGEDFPLYSYEVRLNSGEQIQITRGPAAIRIAAESLPHLSVEGTRIFSKDGQEVFYGDLCIHAHVPYELFPKDKGAHISFEIQGERQNLLKPYHLEFNGEPITQRFHMAELGETFSYGLEKIKIRIIDHLGNRLRTNQVRLWYWGGLREVSADLQFRCDVLPDNLDQDRCVNTTINEAHRLIEPMTHDSEHMIMAFRYGNKSRRFEWRVPNFFFIQKREIRDGHEIVTPIELREQIAVNDIERVYYAITSSEPGEFQLGEWSERFKPGKNSTRQFSSSFLAGLPVGQDDRLRFVTEQGNEIPLLRIVKPLYADGLSTNVSGSQEVLVHIQMLRPVDRIDVQLSELLSGRNLELGLETNNESAHIFEYGRAWLAQDEHNRLTLRLALNSLPTGAWIMTFVGHIGREADLIRNQRKDVYALGLVRNQKGFIETGGPIRQFFEGQPIHTNAEALAILRRTNTSLLQCYEIQSWRTLRWLDDIWRKELLQLQTNISPFITDLIDVAVARPPSDASSSWMLQSVAGAVVPALYAQHAGEYNRVNIKPHPVSKALRAIAKLDGECTNLFIDQVFHFTVALGCDNRERLLRERAMPQGFSVSRFVEALAASSEDVLDGFLGPAHYSEAIQSIENAYRNGLAGNEIRRGQCIMFCQRVDQRFRFIEGRVDLKPHIDPWPITEFKNDEDEQTHANLMTFCHVLSLLAFHCRSETRDPGSLMRFTTLLNEALLSDQRLEAHLSYLLQVGDSVFAYYLLLWEFALRAGFRK